MITGIILLWVIQASEETRMIKIKLEELGGGSKEIDALL